MLNTRNPVNVQKNIYPTNTCPETPGKTLLNTNVPSTKMLNPKNTFNLFSKYKKYPSNLFIIQKISFTDFSRCLSFFFKIPKIPFTFFHYTTNTFTQIEAVPPWHLTFLQSLNFWKKCQIWEVYTQDSLRTPFFPNSKNCPFYSCSKWLDKGFLFFSVKLAKIPIFSN